MTHRVPSPAGRSWFLSLFVGTLPALLLAGCGDPNAGTPDAGSTPDAGDVTPDAGPTEPQVGLTVIEEERAVDLTPDGKTALLWTQSTGALHHYSTVTHTKTTPANLEAGEALATQQPFQMSAKGHIVALYSRPGRPAIWSERRDWLSFPSPIASGGCKDEGGALQEVGTAFGVSDEGDVVVGFFWDGCANGRAFRWNDGGTQGTVTLLDKLGPENTFDRATQVSANGLVVAGSASRRSGESLVDRSPVVWRQDGTGFYLDPNNFSDPGEVKALSADGAVMAGNLASSADRGIQGFRWTAAGGLVRFDSGAENTAFDRITVNDMTADGAIVVGQHDAPTDINDPFFAPRLARAMVHTTAKGLRAVQDVAVAKGVTMPADATLSNVMAINADGTVLLGTVALPPLANDPLQQPVEKLYVLVLPAGAFD